MATRNIVLTEQQEALVHELVATGRYQNTSEALRAGLRLLQQEEQAALNLQARLRAGVEQAGAGELAGGSGADAVRRAFGAARAKAGQMQ
jgi:antitoxin ParD1/3/4